MTFVIFTRRRVRGKVYQLRTTGTCAWHAHRAHHGALWAINRTECFQTPIMIFKRFFDPVHVWFRSSNKNDQNVLLRSKSHLFEARSTPHVSRGCSDSAANYQTCGLPVDLDIIVAMEQWCWTRSFGGVQLAGAGCVDV